MAAPATARQIGAIRTLAAKAGMDDDTYRDFLAREAQVRSARQLSLAAAGHVIDKLKDIVGAPSPAKGAVAGLTSPVARKLQALWIAGWNLGLIEDRTDRAMLSFLERQTGVSHTRFLAHPSDATSAIEALKDWLARAGGVVWPNDRRDDGGDVIAHKWAVLLAQWAKVTGRDISDVRKEDIASFAFKIIGKDLRHGPQPKPRSSTTAAATWRPSSACCNGTMCPLSRCCAGRSARATNSSGWPAPIPRR